MPRKIQKMRVRWRNHGDLDFSEQIFSDEKERKKFYRKLVNDKDVANAYWQNVDHRSESQIFDWYEAHPYRLFWTQDEQVFDHEDGVMFTRRRAHVSHHATLKGAKSAWYRRVTKGGAHQAAIWHSPNLSQNVKVQELKTRVQEEFENYGSDKDLDDIDIEYGNSLI